MSMQERPKAVTLKGNPLTLLGPELKAGDPAPNFTVTANDFKPVTLADFKGKTKVLLPLFSVETPVCDAEMKQFNAAAAELPNTQILVLSMDLPFSQKRYCAAAGVDKIKVLSDYKDKSFSQAYGVLIKESQLTSRAVFVIDPQDKITYVEYVSEIGQQPNFDAVLGHLKEAAKA